MKAPVLKEIRNKLGLSQTKMAQKIGVSLRTIQNWESKKIEIPSKYIAVIKNLISPDVYKNINDIIDSDEFINTLLNRPEIYEHRIEYIKKMELRDKATENRVLKELLEEKKITSK